MSTAPTLTWEEYQKLPPEQRSRPLTPAEYAALRPADDREGAPADFSGPVFPNPNHVRVSDDTDPGGAPTRLPNGVTFQRQNFQGTKPPIDISNPPKAQISTTADWFSDNAPGKKAPATAGAAPAAAAPGAQGGDWFDQNTPNKPAAKKSFFGDPKAFLENRARELQQEAQHQTNLAMGPESAGKPYYEKLGHRLLSLAPDTAAVVDKLVAGGMDWKNALAVASGAVDPAIPAAYFGGHGAGQLLGLEPGVKAGDTSPENVQNALLAGAAVAGAGGSAEAPGAGSTADAIRAGVETAKKVTPKQAAEAVGATSGAVSGHGALSAPGAYYGAKTGGKIAESVLGKERANAPIFPRPAAAKPAPPEPEPEAPPVYPGASEPATPPPELLQGSALQRPGAAPPEPAAGLGKIPVRSPEVAPEATPAPPETSPAPKASTAKLDDLLNDALGGQPLRPGVSLKNQGTSGSPAAKLPEGFTPVDSSALKGFKYDPEAREFESITSGGQHYIHGDVSPEEAQAFEVADSKGKAWQKIRENPLVAKVVNGNRVAVLKSQPRTVEIDPATGRPEFSDVIASVKPEATAASAAKAPAGEDLTSLLQQSLDKVKVGKGGLMTTSEPGALAERWGAYEDSGGMSPEQTEEYIAKLAKAYKNGRPVEPVMETRDASGKVVSVDGRARAIAAERAGVKQIPVMIRRIETNVPAK